MHSSSRSISSSERAPAYASSCSRLIDTVCRACRRLPRRSGRSRLRPLLAGRGVVNGALLALDLDCRLVTVEVRKTGVFLGIASISTALAADGVALWVRRPTNARPQLQPWSWLHIEPRVTSSPLPTKATSVPRWPRVRWVAIRTGRSGICWSLRVLTVISKAFIEAHAPGKQALKKTGVLAVSTPAGVGKRATLGAHGLAEFALLNACVISSAAAERFRRCARSQSHATGRAVNPARVDGR